jgi:hypothetical protein
MSTFGAASQTIKSAEYSLCPLVSVATVFMPIKLY